MNTQTMVAQTTTKKVVCKMPEMGLMIGREYQVLRSYELFNGFWIYVLMIGGRETNYESHLFAEVK